MFIQHLKKQARRTDKTSFPDFDLESKKEKLQTALSGTLSEMETALGLMGVMTIRGIYFRLAAQNLADSYTANMLDIEAFSKSLSYGVLAQKIDPVKVSTVVGVGTHVSYLIMGRIAKRSEWVNYALPKLRHYQSMELKGMQTLLQQFPMLDFICDDNPTADKAHLFMRESYGIDSRRNPNLAYLTLVEDHIKYTKLFDYVYTSIYAAPPLNFLPLEIIYLSLFIDMPLDKELMGIRDRLLDLPIAKDEGILALEEYVARSALG